jgi:hypothetical protein
MIPPHPVIAIIFYFCLKTMFLYPRSIGEGYTVLPLFVCPSICPRYFSQQLKNQLSRQTGSRNLTGPKTLPTIWHTYMKLVTKYQISAINSCWEKYLGQMEGLLCLLIVKNGVGRLCFNSWTWNVIWNSKFYSFLFLYNTVQNDTPCYCNNFLLLFENYVFIPPPISRQRNKTLTIW